MFRKFTELEKIVGFNIEDTALLRHPTVEKAVALAEETYGIGGDFMKKAVKVGEIISVYAKNPDPDAVAAAVYLQAMWYRTHLNGVIEELGAGVGTYLQRFMDFDFENPVVHSQSDAQILLATSVVGLDGVHKAIDDGGWNYHEIRSVLDNNRRAMDAVAGMSEDHALVSFAIEAMADAEARLRALVGERQEKLKFENTGLPDHPLLREVHAYVYAREVTEDSPYGGRMNYVLDAARALVETGASADPDVLAATLLNQFYAKDWEKELARFPARVSSLYAQTSPWLSLSGEKKAEESADVDTIFAALSLTVIERTVQSFDDMRKLNPTHVVIAELERMEDRIDPLRVRAAKVDHPVLKARMQKAAEAADKMIHAPENAAVRKPGSPKFDRGL